MLWHTFSKLGAKSRDDAVELNYFSNFFHFLNTIMEFAESA